MNLSRKKLVLSGTIFITLFTTEMASCMHSHDTSVDTEERPATIPMGLSPAMTPSNFSRAMTPMNLPPATIPMGPSNATTYLRNNLQNVFITPALNLHFQTLLSNVQPQDLFELLKHYFNDVFFWFMATIDHAAEFENEQIDNFYAILSAAKKADSYAQSQNIELTFTWIQALLLSSDNYGRTAVMAAAFHYDSMADMLLKLLDYATKNNIFNRVLTAKSRYNETVLDCAWGDRIRLILLRYGAR